MDVFSFNRPIVKSCQSMVVIASNRALRFTIWKMEQVQTEDMFQTTSALFNILVSKQIKLNWLEKSFLVVAKTLIFCWPHQCFDLLGVVSTLRDSEMVWRQKSATFLTGEKPWQLGETIHFWHFSANDDDINCWWFSNGDSPVLFFVWLVQQIPSDSVKRLIDKVWISDCDIGPRRFHHFWTQNLWRWQKGVKRNIPFDMARDFRPIFCSTYIFTTYIHQLSYALLNVWLWWYIIVYRCL